MPPFSVQGLREYGLGNGWQVSVLMERSLRSRQSRITTPIRPRKSAHRRSLTDRGRQALIHESA
jgi:hypothetical protein